MLCTMFFWSNELHLRLIEKMGEAEKGVDKPDHVKLNGCAGYLTQLDVAQRKNLLLSSSDSHQTFSFLFRPVAFSLNEA